jgi:hypothetical protein
MRLPKYPLSFPQAARLTGLTIDEIRQAIAEQQLPTITTIERFTRIEPEVLIEWFQNRPGQKVGRS